MDANKLIVFTINAEEFGMDIDLIDSIENILEFFKIPSAPDYIEGMINLRGKVHTVFNLRKRFNLPCPEFNESNKIIMANTADSIVGIIADEVKEIIKVENSDFEAAPNTASSLKNKFLSGSVRIGGRTIMLLDIEKVIIAAEDKPAIK